MVYKWASGAIHKVSAQVAGEVCAELEERGELSAENLVEISRPEDAPLHDEFEWDDSIAAEKYRNAQAGAVIRHLTISVESNAPTRAYFHIEAKQPCFESVHAIIQNEDKHAALLKQALRELEAFQRKFNTLSQLKPVFDAIDEFFEKGAT